MNKKEVFLIDLQKRSESFHIRDRSLPPLDIKRRLNDPVYKFNNSGRKLAHRDDHFIFPEYNFSDLAALIELEPFIARSFDRKALLCLKDGFQILCKNQKIVEYLNKRFMEIQHATGISLDSLIEDVVVGLIRFSNHFFVFKRSKAHSSGNRRKTVSGSLDPIAGIFSVPIETVTMRFDEKGDCDAIRQNLYGSYYHFKSNRDMPIFDRNHFCHFSLWPQYGLSVSTPILVGVQDDVSALRKLEENVEILFYQYLFPLYHYQVGTPEAPAAVNPDGRSEVQQAREEITELPSEGCVVTSERHNIEVIGAKDSALDATPILQWYKNRILAGMMSSAIDLGEGDTSNRSTSDTISRLTVDFAKYIQKKVSYFFEKIIFNELLLESTFSQEDLDLPENKVSLFFNEIDLDSLTKRENHLSQLFGQNIITHDEVRLGIGKEILLDSESKKLLMNMNGQLEKDQLEAANALSASKSQPENQHGQKANSEKRKSSLFAESNSSANPLSNHDSSLLGLWKEIKPKLKESKYKESYLFINLELIREAFVRKLIDKFKEGFGDVLEETNKFQELRLTKTDLAEIKTEIKRLTDKLKNEILESDNLDHFDWRFRLIEQAEQSRAYNFGRLRAYSLVTDKQTVSVFKKDQVVKELSVFSRYKELPPLLHPQSEEIIKDI